MKTFRFFLRYWAAIGGLLFVGLAFLVGIQGHQIPTLQRYMILLPILTCRRRNTPYGFASYQADEFEVRHGIATLFRKEK